MSGTIPSACRASDAERRRHQRRAGRTAAPPGWVGFTACARALPIAAGAGDRRRPSPATSRCHRCASRGLDFEPCRADDAPAYFTILIVGHIVVPGLLLMERALHPETWPQMAIWLPTTLVLTLALLPVKGATIAAIWASKQG